MKQLGLLLFLYASVAALGDCGLSRDHDVEKLSYRMEKIASSVRIDLKFPKLATHPHCTSGPAYYGKLWSWEIESGDPIEVSVFDRSGSLAQTFSLTGELALKVTSDRATFNFWGLTPSKRILDHRLVSVEMASRSPLFPLPCFDIDDSGTRRHICGTAAFWSGF